MNRRHFLTATAGLFGSAYLVGCGGGSSTFGGGRGRATITIKWPDRSRFVPQMANSILVQVMDGLTVIDSTLLTRSGGSMTTTATFNDLPIKTLNLYIQAFPNVDGTGVAQAAAVEPITITNGGTASVTATMFTLISSIEITSAGAATSVGTGATLQLTATPKDHDGNIVITPAITWSSTDATKATVSSTGLVTGIAGGNVTIFADDTESSSSGTFNLTVASASVSNIYASGIGDGIIRRYSGINGSGAVTYASSLADVTGIFTRNGKIYMGDYSGGKLARMDNMTGANFTVYNTAPGQGALSVYVDSANRIYFTDYGFNRIVRVDDMSGTNRVDYTTSLSNPSGIWLDSAGRIYFTSSGTNALVRMDDMSGTNRVEYTTGLSVPFGVCIDSADKIYISGLGSNSIVRIDDMTGANLATLTLGYQPYNVRVGGDGRIYSSAEGSIYRVDDMTGANPVTLASTGSNYAFHVD